MLGLIRGIGGTPFSGSRAQLAARPRAGGPLISLFRAAVDLPLRYARQHAAIAAHRNAEGRCAECNAVPMGRDGICDECWVEQHAGP